MAEAMKRSATPETGKRLLQRLRDEAFNGRDLSVLEELFHPEFVNHNETFPLKSKKGPGVFRELYQIFFAVFPDVSTEYHSVIAEGDMVMVYSSIAGTNQGEFMGRPATGKKVEFDVFHLFRVEDGKLVERWGLTDALTMRRQLGLLPE